MAVSLSSRSKVLIIRFSSIGDIVVCTPIIRCIKNQIGCQVHFLQKEKFKEVLSENPYIDKHFYLEQDGLRSSLKKQGYDLVIDLHKNLRTARVKNWLNVRSITYYKANVEKFLLVNLKIDRLPTEHLVDRYFDGIKELGVVNDGAGLDFFIGKLNNEFFFDETYIALVIGAAHHTKQIPVTICKQIIKLSPLKIVLLGGQAELEKSKHLESEKNVLQNLVGKLSLKESSAVLRKSALVITGDTGLMHISAAFQKPIVSVWGSTVPRFGMYPYYESESKKELRVEVSGLSCKPCTKFGKASCPKGHFKCMMDLSAKDIILKTNELLMRN